MLHGTDESILLTVILIRIIWLRGLGKRSQIWRLIHVLDAFLEKLRWRQVLTSSCLLIRSYIHDATARTSFPILDIAAFEGFGRLLMVPVGGV